MASTCPVTFAKLINKCWNTIFTFIISPPNTHAHSAPQHTLLHTSLLEGRLEREALYFVKQLFLTATIDRPNLKIRLLARKVLLKFSMLLSWATTPNCSQDRLIIQRSRLSSLTYKTGSSACCEKSKSDFSAQTHSYLIKKTTMKQRELEAASLAGVRAYSGPLDTRAALSDFTVTNLSTIFICCHQDFTTVCASVQYIQMQRDWRG